jgi:hypothetical protein
MFAHRRGGGLGEGAALVYLHDTDDRQRIIAAAVSDLAGRSGQPAVSPETFRRRDRARGA